MNAKRTAPILTALALALAGCMVMPAETDGGWIERRLRESRFPRAGDGTLVLSA